VGIDSVAPLGGSARICDIDRPAADVQVNPAGNVLTFTAPACTPGAQTQLLVTTPTGSASTVHTYEPAALPVTGSPLWLPLAAGTALTITGVFVLLTTRRRSPHPPTAE
jgi:hypothetical protein